VYDLVVKRFLSVFYPDYIYRQVTVTATIGGEEFFARGRTPQQKGWRAVYDQRDFVEDEEEGEEADDTAQSLPELKVGQQLAVKEIQLKKRKTKPPARYTEAALLSAMERPGKFIADAGMKKVLDLAGGIGTPATRADIIEKLFHAGYMERRGKEIFPLSKGKQLVELVPEALKSPLLTAQWEDELMKISTGAGSSRQFLEAMRRFAVQLIDQVKSSSAAYRHDNLVRSRCPLCGDFLMEISGKRGKRLVCHNRECDYRQELSSTSNARCPQCHKKLEITGSGDKRYYICPCGFRQKFDLFNQRLQENRQSSSKQDVERYLKKQNDESAPSAFAEAWSKARQQDQAPES
jgi:DNA topoisomerase-3